MSFNLCATLNELEDYVEGTRVPEHSNVASLANASKHTRSDSCDFCSAILKLVRGDLQDRFERYTRTAILSLGHWDPSQTSGRFGLTLRMWPDHFAFLRDMGRNMLQTDGHETAGAPVFIEETVDGSQRFMGDESATSSRLFGLDLERRLAPTIVEVEKSSQTKEEWQWLANEYPSLISPLIRTVLGEISDGTACESFYNQLRSSRKRQRGVELDPGTRNDDSHPRLSKKRRTAAGIVSIASRTNSLQVDDEESAAYEALTEDHLLIIKKDEQHNLPEYPKDGYPGFGAAAVKQWNFDLVWANEIKSVIHSVPRSPTDQEVIRKIRRWLETCQTSHRCLKDKTRPILPTRVIDVGVDGGPGPRLVHTNGQKGRYATLSHCWGKGNPMKTTRANIYAMMAGIKFDDMSPLFQDAVRVCRVLDIPYLWIVRNLTNMRLST